VSLFEERQNTTEKPIERAPNLGVWVGGEGFQHDPPVSGDGQEGDNAPSINTAARG